MSSSENNTEINISDLLFFLSNLPRLRRSVSVMLLTAGAGVGEKAMSLVVSFPRRVEEVEAAEYELYVGNSVESGPGISGMSIRQAIKEEKKTFLIVM